MADDPGLDEDLCALTALNDVQIAGLDTLAGLDEEGLAEFQARVDAAWNANRVAVGEAKATVASALRNLAHVETDCGLMARARFIAEGARGLPQMSTDEKAAVAAARDVLDDARQTHAAALERFKAGVSAEQLGAADAA